MKPPSARTLARRVKQLEWELGRAKEEHKRLTESVKGAHAELEVYRKIDAAAGGVLSEMRTYANALWRAANALEEDLRELRDQALHARLKAEGKWNG